MSTSTALVIEPAASWRRLQPSSEFFFEDLDTQMKEHPRQFLEALMGYERQCSLNAHPYERTEQRVDQANGFYRRQLTTRLGQLELAVPRTRSGCFHPQVLPRDQRREPVINEALKQVFLLGVSTRQTGHAPGHPRRRCRQCRHRQHRRQGFGCLGPGLPSPQAHRPLPLSHLRRRERANSLGGQGAAPHGALRLP